MQAFLIRLPIIMIVGLTITVIVVGLVFFGILPGRSPSQEPEVTLQFWGVEDSAQNWLEIFAEYKKEHPKVEIVYRLLDKTRYEEELVNALAEGRGPDIFVLKNSWVQKHKDKISAFPQNDLGFSTVDFTRQFADIAAQDLIAADGQILGMPLYIDTPALFYNKDEFNAAGIVFPPKNWDALATTSRVFTRKNRAGDILKSGVALGTSQNTSHAFEILSSVFFEFGDPIIDYRTNSVTLRQESQRALALYASFADQNHANYSWSERLPDSLDALASGISVMTIGFAEDVRRVLKKNPHLSLGVSDFPQQAGRTSPVLYGRYFFPTVSLQSQNQKAAWQFLLFVAAGDGAALYQEKFRRPPALREIIALGPPSVLYDSFWRQTLWARSFPVPDEEKTRKIFGEAIDALATKASTANEAIQSLSSRLSSLMIR